MKGGENMVKICRTSERKTRQVTMAFKPSVYTAFQKVAYMQHIAPNGLLGELIEQHVQQHLDLIQKYDEENPEQ